MPRFSVVVPAHGAHGAHGGPGGPAARTLDSVLAQSFGDFELIAVCDEPETPSADLVAALAGRDGRVTAAHCPSRAGPGAVRTTGMREATGAHLLFLDGGDLLLPGALAALDARLRETGPVDVLHFAHERETGGGAPPLPPAPAGAFAPEAVPGLTAVNRPVCGAAYRRGFLTVHQLAFPYGGFADVGWGGLVTVLAGRLAVLRSVAVRRRPPARDDAGDPFDLLDQVELVLSWAAAEELSGERSYALFDQLFAEVLKTLSDATPPRERRAFFHRASVLYRRHRPTGHRAREVRHLLLASGAYPALRAADRLAARAAGRAGIPAPQTLRAVAAARPTRSV